MTRHVRACPSRKKSSWVIWVILATGLVPSMRVPRSPVTQRDLQTALYHQQLQTQAQVAQGVSRLADGVVQMMAKQDQLSIPSTVTMSIPANQMIPQYLKNINLYTLTGINSMQPSGGQFQQLQSQGGQFQQLQPSGGQFQQFQGLPQPQGANYIQLPQGGYYYQPQQAVSNLQPTTGPIPQPGFQYLYQQPLISYVGGHTRPALHRRLVCWPTWRCAYV